MRGVSSCCASWCHRYVADAGGLIVYSPDLSDNFARAATYVDKIFKGAKPGDLPIEQASIWRLIVNRQAARELGITLPPSVLAAAELR
jgi:putative tryptophan/tyrosine transport system substrate-binding protein